MSWTGALFGLLFGWASAASLFAALRLLRPQRVISSGGEAIQSALHAATAMLPGLRRGLSLESASRAAPPLLMLTQAVAVALTDREPPLACFGDHDVGDWPGAHARRRRGGARHGAS